MKPMGKTVELLFRLSPPAAQPGRAKARPAMPAFAVLSEGLLRVARVAYALDPGFRV